MSRISFYVRLQSSDMHSVRIEVFVLFFSVQ